MHAIWTFTVLNPCVIENYVYLSFIDYYVFKIIEQEFSKMFRPNFNFLSIIIWIYLIRLTFNSF